MVLHPDNVAQLGQRIAVECVGDVGTLVALGGKLLEERAMGFSLGSLLDTIIVVECDDVVLHVRIQVAIHLGYRECSIVVALEGEGDVAQPDLRRLVVGDREAVGEKFGRAQPFGLHDDGERLDGVSAVVRDIGYIVLGDARTQRLRLIPTVLLNQVPLSPYQFFLPTA